MLEAATVVEEGIQLRAAPSGSPPCSLAPPTAAANAATAAATGSTKGDTLATDTAAEELGAGEAAGWASAAVVSEATAMLASGGEAAAAAATAGGTGGGAAAAPCMRRFSASVASAAALDSPARAGRPAASVALPFPAGAAGVAASAAPASPLLPSVARPSAAAPSAALFHSPAPRAAAVAAASGAGTDAAAFPHACLQRVAQVFVPSSPPPVHSGAGTPELSRSLDEASTLGVCKPASTCRSPLLLSFCAVPVTAADPPANAQEILSSEQEAAATAALAHDDGAPASPSAAVATSSRRAGGEGAAAAGRTGRQQQQLRTSPLSTPLQVETTEDGSSSCSCTSSSSSSTAASASTTPALSHLHASEVAAAASLPAGTRPAAVGLPAAAAGAPDLTYRPAVPSDAAFPCSSRAEQQQEGQQQQQQQHQGRERWEPLRLGGIAVFPMGGGAGGETVLRSFLVAKLAAAVGTGVLLLLAVTHINVIGYAIKQLLQEIRSLGNLSPLAFFAAYTLLVMFFVPAEALNVAAGFIFVGLYGNAAGLAVAATCCMAGLLAASAACVTLSRHVFSEGMQRLFRNSDLYQAFQLAVEEGGTCFVALVRLSPVLPFAVTCYLFGLTPLTLQQLLVGSLSSIVLVFFFNCMGAALKDVDDVDISHFHWTWKQSLLGLFGVIMALVSVGYIGELTRRKLAEASELAARRRLQQQTLLSEAEEGEVVTSQTT